MNTIRAIRKQKNKILIMALMAYVLSQAGCAPTYPKEIVDEAIIQLCREEYNVEVKVKIVGKSIAVYIPIENLFNAMLTISEESADKINSVLLSASRVTLSTDAPLDFYIVIAQDPMLPEIEVILIRYVYDIKMLHYEQISRGEFSKRMLVEVKLTPQAQKEKVLRDIFGRLNIKETDELIAEYMKTSEATTIGDMGYWDGAFFVKDIGKGEFLGLQIAERSKAEFRSAPSLSSDFKLNLIKGEFLGEGGKNFFRFSFDITPLDEFIPFVNEEEVDKIFDIILNTAANVLHGYKFKDCWNIEIIDVNNNQVIFATLDELDELRKKKIKLEELRRWYK